MCIGKLVSAEQTVKQYNGVWPATAIHTVPITINTVLNTVHSGTHTVAPVTHTAHSAIVTVYSGLCRGITVQIPDRAVTAPDTWNGTLVLSVTTVPMAEQPRRADERARLLHPQGLRPMAGTNPHRHQCDSSHRSHASAHPNRIRTCQRHQRRKLDGARRSRAGILTTVLEHSHTWIKHRGRHARHSRRANRKKGA